MTPDAVIFDMDGLLIDTETLSQAAFRHAIKVHGLTGYDELFLSLVGSNETRHTELIERELGELVDTRAFRGDWTDKMQQLTAKPIPVLPGVIETLTWLNKNNIKTAVATSTGSIHAAEKLERTGLRKYFQSVTCGDEVERSKPFPDIYLEAGARVKAKMSMSLGLEDSTNGVKSAHAAGLNVIQIPNVVPTSPEVKALGVRVCSSMHDVLTLLRDGEAIAMG